MFFGFVQLRAKGRTQATGELVSKTIPLTTTTIICVGCDCNILSRNSGEPTRKRSLVVEGT